MIEIKNVSFSYDASDTETKSDGRLKNINLLIPDGQVVLLCGESGCGKTTLTRLINGLIPHFYEGNLEGKVGINGKDVTEIPLYETAFLVGTVFQNPRSQFFNVDTTSEIAFGLENRGLAADVIMEKVNQTVKEFQIEKLMNRNIFKLSGGEKQKIAGASVAACSPDIYLLDEPSANLDKKAMYQLREMILRWKAQGKTIVIAEHRLAYIWDLIDRAVLLKQGEIFKDFDVTKIREMTPEDMHGLGLRSNVESVLKEDKMPDAEDTDHREMIEFRDFSFAYGKELVLSFSKLAVKEKQITTVVGSNGIGKSTFLRCICGLEKKCKGTMYWHGNAYGRKKRLNEIFLVMQDVNHQLFTESVLDEVLISMKEEDEKKAEEILALLDLAEYKNRHPLSLSGGQKQRLAVATAVASEREIVLFDEPTSGLDHHHMLQVGEILKRLAENGKTVLVVTHDTELIETLNSDVIDLEKYNHR